MSKREILQKQDWKSITAKAAKFAYKNLFAKHRSWDKANELAQEAVFKTFEHPDAWDPEKEHILKHVCLRIISIMSNERSLARNTFEVAMGDHPRLRKVPDPRQESPEEALDRMQMAERFRTELAAALHGKELASDVLAMMIESVESPGDDAKKSTYKKEQLLPARRVLFYHADKISAELARELDEEDDDEEVAQ